MDLTVAAVNIMPQSSEVYGHCNLDHMKIVLLIYLGWALENLQSVVSAECTVCMYMTANNYKVAFIQIFWNFAQSPSIMINYALKIVIYSRTYATEITNLSTKVQIGSTSPAASWQV